MIAIINQNKKNDKGETLYNLQINNRLITTFYHEREKGLTVCLERAMGSARKIEVGKVIRFLDGLKA